MTDLHIRVVAASKHPEPDGGILYTVDGRLPTVGLAQLNTHGWFARSAASMRAIPTERVLAAVEADPYMPEFGANQRGMVAGLPLDDPRCAGVWLSARDRAVQSARQLAKLGVHKEVVNRLVQPWSFTRVVVTGRDTAWANFLSLRNQPSAFAPLRDFALQAGRAIRSAVPTALDYGDWHLPYAAPGAPVCVSVARCARVSYQSNATGRDTTLDEDQALHDRLLGAVPMHASPAEHQAEVTHCRERPSNGRAGIGWRVYRKTLDGEVQINLTAELSRLA